MAGARRLRESESRPVLMVSSPNGPSPLLATSGCSRQRARRKAPASHTRRVLTNHIAESWAERPTGGKFLPSVGPVLHNLVRKRGRILCWVRQFFYLGGHRHLIRSCCRPARLRHAFENHRPIWCSTRTDAHMFHGGTRHSILGTIGCSADALMPHPFRRMWRSGHGNFHDLNSGCSQR